MNKDILELAAEIEIQKQKLRILNKIQAMRKLIFELVLNNEISIATANKILDKYYE